MSATREAEQSAEPAVPSPLACEPTITEHVRRFRRRGDPRALVAALRCTIVQGRLPELAYGAYCFVTSRPATLARPHAVRAGLVQRERRLDAAMQTLSRDDLVARHGDRYAMHALPADFEPVREQTLCDLGTSLVIGEYAERSARIAVVTPGRCTVSAPYADDRGVRHIHLVEPAPGGESVYVTTGDATKVLDRVTVRGGSARIAERLRARWAGYTAAATVGGVLYFGTDFSSRPNFLATLDGRKFFFPEPAYTRWVAALLPMGDRYLVAVNVRLEGWRRTISVFDASASRFVLCEAWEDVFDPGPPPAIG